jgi:hypothetical protein
MIFAEGSLASVGDGARGTGGGFELLKTTDLAGVAKS